MTPSLEEASASVRESVVQATRGLIERDTLAELVVLGAVAGEHLLVIGPPGTGKSQVVRRVARALGGSYFEYLLGRFTEPNEIFGPVDLRKLREGLVETETKDMLPEAHIAFLDEVFLGSTAILNTLLAILNERLFVRGHTRRTCPLRICVGASNTIPNEETLAAFADRFLLHTFVDPLSDGQLERLLEGGWAAQTQKISHVGDLSHLDHLGKIKSQVDLQQVRQTMAHGFRLLRKAGILLSDRRMVRCQSLVAAACVMAGRQQAQPADLWPIVYAIPTKDGQTLGREVLAELLAETRNPVLPAAAEDASRGPLVRADRLREQGQALLAQAPEHPDEAYLLKLEGLAREIDAGLAPEQRDEALQNVYQNIAQRIDSIDTVSDAS